MPEKEQKEVTYFPDREVPARSNSRVFDFGLKGRIELAPGTNLYSEEALTMLAADTDYQTLVKIGAVQLPEGYTPPEPEQAQQQVEQQEGEVIQTTEDDVPLPAPINTPLVVNIETGETPTVDPEIAARSELEQAEQQREAAAQTQGTAESAVIIPPEQTAKPANFPVTQPEESDDEDEE